MNDKVFFKYNQTIQKECEKNLEQVTNNQEYYSLINSARKAFETQLLDGISVEQVIQSAIEQHGIDTVIDTALTICDMYIPYSLIRIMQNTLGFEGIIAKINDGNRLEADKSSLINAMIGLDEDDVLPYLINLIVSTDSDLIKEEAVQVLSLLDKEKVYNKTVENISQKGIQDDLLALLVSITKDTKQSDQTYQLLRTYFMSSPNKPLIANILADLNDSRAVVFLRGYLLKSINNISKAEIIDICGAISRLGGNVEDLIKFDNNMNF